MRKIPENRTKVWEICQSEEVGDSKWKYEILSYALKWNIKNLEIEKMLKRGNLSFRKSRNPELISINLYLPCRTAFKFKHRKNVHIKDKIWSKRRFFLELWKIF